MDTKKVESIMTRLQSAKLKVLPAIQQIVRTTTIYSEYEFKQKLRSNEPIFCLERSELQQAVEAIRLLSGVEKDLKCLVFSFENSEQLRLQSMINDPLNSIQSEEHVEKSIASSMKEITVNRLSIDPNNQVPSNKIYLDQNMIKRLMELHENIILTMESLQDRNIEKKVHPLVKDLEKFQNMSSSEQTIKNKKSAKVNAKNKCRAKKIRISNKKPKKYIILPPEKDTIHTTDTAEILDDDVDWIEDRNEEDTDFPRRKTSDPDGFRYGRTINLDIGNIDNTSESIDTFLQKEDKTEDEEIIKEVAIPNKQVVDKISNTKFPESNPNNQPIMKRSVLDQVDDINIQSICEAKMILRTCLEKLSCIRNNLSETVDCSMKFHKNLRNLMKRNGKDADIDPPDRKNIHSHVSTDTADLNQINKESTCRCSRPKSEFHQLLQKVLNQIEYMQKLLFKKKESETRLENGNIPTEINKPKKFKDCHVYDAMAISAPKVMHVKSILQIVCAQELYHPDPFVKSQLNNIGLQNLINSAAPSQCANLVIVNDPRDLPEMPLKASLNSLPLSKSDLLIIQNNVDRMKKMLDY